MRSVWVRLTLVAAAGCVVAMLGAQVARAQTYTVLHSFSSTPDGNGPYAGVIEDASGNLYGTTIYGGTYGGGAVFQLSPAGQETILYSFTGGGDGGYPFAGVVEDAKGNFYGTTMYGGILGTGVVFRLSRKANQTRLDSTNVGDGSDLFGGVILDSKGYLYGTTFAGGAANAGTAFRLDKKGNVSGQYSFTGQPDGYNPVAGLIRDAGGNLYGTTLYGGTYNAGAVFEISRTGKETILYSFTGGADGAFPWASLIQDADGNFYGTTEYGGEYGAGTVFKVSPSGQETALYSFTGGADGATPIAPVIRDASGNLFGTTFTGGADSYGNVFELSPSGQETVLYTFTGGTDGASPGGALLEDGAGNLFGTATKGGAYSYGVVFKLTLPQKAKR